MSVSHDYIGLSDASSLKRSSEASNISSDNVTNNVFNLKATELSLGLPGFGKSYEENAAKGGGLAIKNYMSGAKRGFYDISFNGVFEKNQTQQLNSSSNVKHVEEEKKGPISKNANGSVPPSAKAQVVGWPPIRSFRKNTMSTNLSKSGGVADLGSEECLYVKVSMDGAPYLRKIDLKIYHNYEELSKALEKMFSCFTLGQSTSSGIKGREGLTESNLKDLLHSSECVLTYEDKEGDWMLVGDVPWEMFIDSCKRLRIMKGSEATGLDCCLNPIGKGHNWKETQFFGNPVVNHLTFVNVNGFLLLHHLFLTL
ncbi:auxin-responsive protein IAA14-like [Bidens hawaiensis]|uniref:auxin-responsive protein IAA14-like n=1 Tax=Bidens hawaiensis TaxID=980011 RepID=UPI00404B8252